VPSRNAALVLVGLALLSALTVMRGAPPPAKPESAPVNEFSAARAHEELADLVGDGEPHPSGTAAHDRVRDALASKLGALGFDVEQATSFVCGARTCANVTNLLGRLPGRVGAKAVLLTAHYDSVPAGPGASDDGMGVATLLEIARALKASAALRRPVWILVSDGEELGLFGAKAFVKNKRLLDEIGVVVNVEARGTEGASLMFETSPNNAGLVASFAKNTEHPVASSVFPTIYSLLPNDTDLTVYKAAGLPGLNYAFVGGAARYHTPKDDLGHADIRSLQHQGDNVLAMVRALADGRDSAVASTDLVFFDVLGAFVVRWPVTLGPWIVLGLLGVYAASTLLAMKKGLMTLREHLLGLLGVLTLPAAAAVAWGCGAGFRLLGAAPAPWIAHPNPWIAASCGLGGLAAGLVTRWVGRGAGMAGLLWGATTVMTGIGAALALTLPGLSFLFLVPAILGSLGSLAWVLGGNAAAQGRTVLWSAWMPIGAVLVWVPLLSLLYDALGVHLLPAAAAGTGLVVWTAGPLLAALSSRMRARLFSAAATGSLVAAAGALAVTHFTVDVPAHVSLRTYVAEGEEAKTTLSTYDVAPTALASLFPRRDLPWPWASERGPSVPLGPAVPIPSPTFELVSDTSQGSTRHLVARLRSSRGASVVGLALPPSAGSDLIRVQGESLEPPRPSHDAAAWRSFECVTTPPEGLEVELTLDASGHAAAYVYDRTPGVPETEPQKLSGARPSYAVPYQNGDLTVAARRVEL
jgi:hypothetical protein